MMKALLFLLLLVQPARTLPTPQEWDAAERNIVRLKPAAFPDLPAAVRADLERRQCTIPQSDFYKEPHNVISGRFISGTQQDIAVLCSVRGVSSILVFRAAGGVATLAPAPDKNYLQTGGPATIEFSRGIFVAGPKTIRAYHEAFGGGKLPTLDHDGINDAFLDKASVVHYWSAGKWLQLQGAD